VGIRPTDLPLSPIRESEHVRRVEPRHDAAEGSEGRDSGDLSGDDQESEDQQGELPRDLVELSASPDHAPAVDGTAATQGNRTAPGYSSHGADGGMDSDIHLDIEA